MNLPDLTHLIEPLARKLFGEPDRRFSRGSELRFGPRASFMIDVKRGTWLDYERQRGGDVCALLKERFGCVSEQQCLEWLEREGLIGDSKSQAAAGAKVDGGGGTPHDDDERALEEARAEFPEDEPEPQLQPAAEDPTGDAAEGAGDGSFSHIWRSKDHDFPCSPTGKEQRDDAGRIYARVRTPDGDQNFVPKDELAPKDDPDAEPEQPEPEPEPARDEAPQQKAPDDDLAIVLAAKLKRKPDGPFSVEELAQFARLKREQPLPFARLCVRYGALVAAVKLDAASAQAALERASKEEVVELFIELALSADLNAVEIDKLRRLVTEKFDVGLQPLKDLLKQAQAEQAKQRAKQERARRLAARTDPRPMVRVPADSAPFLPEMAKVNAVLKFSQQTVPPGRDIDRFATRLRKLSVPKMHAFGQTQSNPPGDDDHD